MASRLLRTITLCGLVLAATFLVAYSSRATEQTPDTPLEHTVQKGDTVWEIARKYGVKPDEIIELNKLQKPYSIFPGQVLVIRAPVASSSDNPKAASDTSPKHVVKTGDTVWGIARQYNVNPDEIIEINNLRKPYLIFPGQVLIIPGFVAPMSREHHIAALCRLPRGVRPRNWRYIVVHHSDTTTGNAAIFDRNHRRRGMENGLAYHFVIGNGKGAGDGEIEAGGRWSKQLHGGYCRSPRMNEIGIGICLVGNFQRQHPTKKQMDSLVRLVKYLATKYEIPKRRVIGHRDVRGSSTECPGKNLSVAALRNRL